MEWKWSFSFFNQTLFIQTGYPVRTSFCKPLNLETVLLENSSTTFNRSCNQPTDEKTLQDEKHDQRYDDRNKGAAGEDFPVVATGSQQFTDFGCEHDLFITLAKKDQRDQQVIPDPEELQNCE